MAFNALEFTDTRLISRITKMLNIYESISIAVISMHDSLLQLKWWCWR